MAIFQIPTLSQRIAVVRQRVLSNNNSLATQAGSVINDAFISTLSVSDIQQMALTYLLMVGESINGLLALKQDQNTLGLLAAAQQVSVNDVLTQISGMIDAWGSNFNLTRLQPTYASSQITLGCVTPPSADITIGPGKVISNGAGQPYSTTGTATLYSATPVLDPNLLLYTITVPIQANNIGSIGNTDENTITIEQSVAEGLPFATNLEPLTNGTDLETDEDFGPRILLQWQAVGKTTLAGVQNTAEGVVGVQSVYVAQPGDPLSTRGSVKTDVYVQGQAPTLYTESFTAFNSPDYPGAITPSKLPLISLASVNTGTAVARLDTTSPREGSVASSDTIQFSTPPTFPVTISYTYDAQPRNVQTALGNPDVSPVEYETPVDRITAMDTPILAKAGTAVDIDYTVTIMVQPGYVPAAVITAVQTAIAAFAATYTLGETIYVDDLNKTVEGVAGVLRLAGDPTKFALTQASGVEDSIAMANNQYVNLLNVNIFG